MLAEGRDKSNKGGGSTVWTITVAFGLVLEEEEAILELELELDVAFFGGRKVSPYCYDCVFENVFLLAKKKWELTQITYIDIQEMEWCFSGLQGPLEALEGP